MVCYYYPFCQNQFAEHQQHMTTLQNYSGILWHDAFVPHGTGLHGCAMTAHPALGESPFSGM